MLRFSFDYIKNKDRLSTTVRAFLPDRKAGSIQYINTKDYYKKQIGVEVFPGRILIEVLGPFKKSELSQLFLLYDTENKYKFPPTMELCVILFLIDKKELELLKNPPPPPTPKPPTTPAQKPGPTTLKDYERNVGAI